MLNERSALLFMSSQDRSLRVVEVLGSANTTVKWLAVALASVAFRLVRV